MSRDAMDRRIAEHSAFEARDDVDGVLATPDAEHDIIGRPSGPAAHRDVRSAAKAAAGRSSSASLQVTEFGSEGTIQRENVRADLAAIARQLPQD